MKNYKAVLFAPDGEYVTDFSGRKNIEDVWSMVADMGSRWIFYPIPFVTTDKTIVGTIEGLEHLKGKRIETVKKILANTNQKLLCDYLNNGWPLQDIIN
jgi:hypothetical protein